MSLKWIFFDLDNTLFDFSTASLESLERLWKEEKSLNGIFHSSDSFLDEFHIHNSLMWQLHERGEITSDFLKSERFRLTIAPESHDKETLHLCRQLNDRYLWMLGECNCLCTGAYEALETLSKDHLIGVLTNGFTEVQYRKINTTGISRFIQRMVISDEIGIQKPNPRIFRYAEEETGAKSESTLMIGDNPSSDIKGAIGAGWKAIYFDRKGDSPIEDTPGLIGQVTDLRRVVSLIRESQS